MTEMLTMRTAVSVKGKLAVSTGNSNPDPQWHLVSRYCQITFDLHCKCPWELQNQRRQRAMYFKSSLFISLIKCPIVSSFNHKLLTRLFCPFIAIVRAVTGPEWSEKLTKESVTAEWRFSKQTSTAHADNFGERQFIIDTGILRSQVLC